MDRSIVASQNLETGLVGRILVPKEGSFMLKTVHLDVRDLHGRISGDHTLVRSIRPIREFSYQKVEISFRPEERAGILSRPRTECSGPNGAVTRISFQASVTLLPRPGSPEYDNRLEKRIESIDCGQICKERHREVSSSVHSDQFQQIIADCRTHCSALWGVASPLPHDPKPAAIADPAATGA